MPGFQGLSSILEPSLKLGQREGYCARGWGLFYRMREEREGRGRMAAWRAGWDGGISVGKVGGWSRKCVMLNSWLLLCPLLASWPVGQLARY